MVQASRRFAALALVAAVCACFPFAPDGSDQEVRSNGTVEWYDLEGGFYAILGSDGVTYDPINLPEEFAQDGLPVWFVATIRDDLAGIHMVGPIVELQEIRRR